MTKRGRQTPNRATPASNTATSRALIVLALAGLAWFVFGQVRNFEFVNWDDHEYVTESAAARAGLSGEGVAEAFTSNVAGNWHPLTVLSHQLDVQLFGLDAGAHHATSLVLHLLSALILFGLLRALTGSIGRSAFVAALFLVHPLHVESVAWVSERKDVLSTLFALLAVRTYVSDVRRPSAARYVSVLALYALALLSKPMVITLPFLLILLDVWPLGRVAFAKDQGAIWRRLLLEKLPLITLAVTVGLITVATQANVGAIAGLGVSTPVDRVLQAIVSYGAYLGKTFWPAGLAAFYPRQAVSIPILVATALALVAISVFAIRERKRRPYILVGWAWYLITLAPVIGIVQVGEQAMADRYTYVGLIGILIIIAWGAVDTLGSRMSTVALAVAGCVLVLASSFVARTQAGYWKDSVTLWQHAIDVAPPSYRPHENLGTALRERGELDRALAAYTEAARLSPTYAVAYNSMGLVLARQGKTPEAIRQFDEAVRLQPDFVEARTNLANALSATGRLDDAAVQFREALRLKPGSTDARIGLGSTRLRLGQPAEAEKEFAEAVRIDPAVAEAHNGLGASIATQGRHAEAVPHYREALRIKPTLVTALNNLALSLITLNQLEEARRLLESALKIDPSNATARQALAALSGKQS